MLAAQYPNGAWPQQYAEAINKTSFPVKKASFPPSWSRTYRKTRYTDYYTLNDGNMSHIIDMLFEAHRIYDRQDCYAAAVKTADFFVLAQMPEPQPGWAQQYNVEMHPVWARKFEPPAITGGESQGVMKKLLDVYQHTGDAKFLEPIPVALAYYRRSLLPDGRLARFYELETNRPLYFTMEYQLTESDRNMPTHYAFKIGSSLDSIERKYQRLLKTSADKLRPTFKPVKRLPLSPKLASEAEKVIQAMDSRGAWIQTGRMQHQNDELDVIETRTLIRNLEILARYAGAVN